MRLLLTNDDGAHSPGIPAMAVALRDVALKPDTDTALVDAGYVTVTGLVGIRAESDDSGSAAGDIEAALKGAP